MNITWLMWFNRGFFHKRTKSPISGAHGDKKWSDTYQEKTGKGQYEEKDNGWNDDSIWRD